MADDLDAFFDEVEEVAEQAAEEKEANEETAQGENGQHFLPVSTTTLSPRFLTCCPFTPSIQNLLERKLNQPSLVLSWRRLPKRKRQYRRQQRWNRHSLRQKQAKYRHRLLLLLHHHHRRRYRLPQ